jgi:hypothetical protein
MLRAPLRDGLGGNGAGALADDVAQDADALHLELDDVARLDPAVELQAAAAPDGAASEHVARQHRLLLREVGDDLGERVEHRAEAALGPRLAVHARGHPGRREVELVRRDEAWAHGGREVLPQPGPEADLHLAELDVTGAPVVEDRVAGDRVGGLGHARLPHPAGDHRGDLQLEVEVGRVVRPRDRHVGADHRVRIALPVDRDLIPGVRDAAEAVADVLLDEHEVADGVRPRQRGEQLDVVERQDGAAAPDGAPRGIQPLPAGPQQLEHRAADRAEVQHAVVGQRADRPFTFRHRAVPERHQPHGDSSRFLALTLRTRHSHLQHPFSCD